MFPLTKPIIATDSQTDSNSQSSSSANLPQPWINQLDKRLWRAIDFLHIFVMIFAMFTSVIIGSLRIDLFDQCPLYAKVYIRQNRTQLTSGSFTSLTIWGNVYLCEGASFAYLSAFALSFISLWIHVVFRRVLRTERLLRLPIGLTTLVFTIIALVATIIVSDGITKLCTQSDANLCTSAGPVALANLRWKIISLPVGGWLTTLALALNAIARGIQLFSKPKKSPAALKFFLNQMMAFRQQEKLDRDSSYQGSQTSRFSSDRLEVKPSDQRIPINNNHQTYPSQDLTDQSPASFYPPIPQYRQIKKPSLFRRICCPCFRRRRRRHRSSRNPYESFTVIEPYFPSSFNRTQTNNLSTSNHLCSRHSIHQHQQSPSPTQTERLAPIDSISARLSPDASSDASFPGRRRSSVRFEDQAIELPEKKENEQSTSSTPIDLPESSTHLQRSVSFRNNEDDLWTTVTINAEASTSSHFNRLALEKISSNTTTTSISTNIPVNENGITAIRVNSQSNTDPDHVYQTTELPISSSYSSAPPPPPAPPMPLMTSNRHRRNPFPPRSFTPSSEDDGDLRHIKPVEEIQTIVMDKYNYNDLSEALKSNVQRLKKTFLSTNESMSSHYDRPKNLRIESMRTVDNDHRASDC